MLVLEEGPGRGGLLFVAEVLSRLCRRGHARAVARALWHSLAAQKPTAPDSRAPTQGVRAALGSIQDEAALAMLLASLLATAGRAGGGEPAGRMLSSLLQGTRWERHSSVRCVPHPRGAPVGGSRLR